MKSPMPAMNVVHPLAFVVDYQPTASSTLLTDWWQRIRRGVCCLVGIGGCGKTATLDHFLRAIDVIPGSHRTVDGDQDTMIRSRPRGALVFSMSEGNPDLLFRELDAWTTSAPTNNESPTYQVIVRNLMIVAQEASEPLLIVIDGLEHIQSIGGKDGSGHLIDQRVRDLLIRAAYGALPGLCVVATTRLPLIDIEVQRLPDYRKIEMDAMDQDAAIALLRARGARDSDRALRQVAEAYGYHALTLDVLGRYIREAGSPQPLLTAIDERPSAAAPDTGRAETLVRQLLLSIRAKEIVSEEFDASESVLEFLSILHRPVSVKFIADTMSNVNSEESFVQGALDVAVVRTAIVKLLDLRLVRRIRCTDDERYSLHEIIREVVYRDIPVVRRTAWHDTLAEIMLEQAASLRSTGTAASNVLDLLEDAVHHQVRGSQPFAAFLTYWQQIGNYSYLGHVTSDFARGERLCRSLNMGRPPEELADYLTQDPRGADSALLGDWALYLLMLGEAATAVRVFSASRHRALVSNRFVHLPITARNLSWANLERGDIVAGRFWAEEGLHDTQQLLEKFEGIPTEEVMRGFDENITAAASALALSGDVELVSSNFDTLRALHRSASASLHGFADAMPFYRGLMPNIPSGDLDIEALADGRPWSTWLLQRGMSADALAVVRKRLERFGEADRTACVAIELREIAARALIDLDDIAEATKHVNAMMEWSTAHESPPYLCRAKLLVAAIALAESDAETAYVAASEGLRIAQECGLGITHNELLVVLGEAALALGYFDEALHAAATTLFGQEPLERGVALYQARARYLEMSAGTVADERAGIFPPPETGKPSLLATMHPQCGYRLGEAAARHLLGEALLGQLVQESHRTTFNYENLSTAARTAIERARSELQHAAHVLESLVPADRHGTHRRIQAIRQRLSDLESGVLPHYDIREESSFGPASTEVHQPQLRILISYSHRDAAFADQLATDLEQVFGDVWIDHRRVHIGESFVSAINQALLFVTDFIVILSDAAKRSKWVENELNAAIARRNQGKFIRIRPVLVDHIDLPPLIADLVAVHAGPTTYSEGLKQLVAAIGSTD